MCGNEHARPLISDVYIQEGARMLVVSRCWVSDRAAIASKSQDTKAAALDEARRNYEKSSRNCISTNFDGLLRCGHHSARRYGWNATHVWRARLSSTRVWWTRVRWAHLWWTYVWWTYVRWTRVWWARVSWTRVWSRVWW